MDSPNYFSRVSHVVSSKDNVHGRRRTLSEIFRDLRERTTYYGQEMKRRDIYHREHTILCFFLSSSSSSFFFVSFFSFFFFCKLFFATRTRKASEGNKVWIIQRRFEWNLSMTRARNFTRRCGNRDLARNANDVAVVRGWKWSLCLNNDVQGLFHKWSLLLELLFCGFKRFSLVLCF